MKPLAADTHPNSERVQLEILRTMPAWRKLQLMEQLNQSRDFLALCGLRQRYPHASPTELQWHLFVLKSGQERVEQVYGSLETWIRESKQYEQRD